MTARKQCSPNSSAHATAKVFPPASANPWTYSPPSSTPNTAPTKPRLSSNAGSA
ncbi:hypothetical protein HK104_006875, partial [Borealophlyctis nickersoniae]